MKYQVISFDLQGTLSDSAFSDEFWLETLPRLYAKSKRVTVKKAKKELKAMFQKWGKYDYRYYSLEYWLKELGLVINFNEIIALMNSKPCFFRETIPLLKKLKQKVKLILVSTTTKEFIDAELGARKKHFTHIFSSLDDFNIAGKPTEIYVKIAEQLKVAGSKILHIGDCQEMDIENAQKAGWQTFFFDKEIPKRKVLSELNKRLEE